MLKLRKADGVTKLDLALPKEAKQGLMDALADGLDKLSVIATMVGDAKEDDAAQPPADLGAAIAQVCEVLQGAATQFAGGGDAPAAPEKPADGAGATPPPEGAGNGPPPPEMGKRAPVGKAELDNLTAATVTIDAARTQLWSASDMMGKDPAGAAEKIKGIVGMLDNAVGFMGAATSGMTAPAEGAPAEGEAAKAAKALPPELHDGDSLKNELHDGDSFKSELHKCVAVGHATAAKLAKAGRKMAGARFEKLKTLHDSLGSLLNDLAYDEASSAGAPAAKKDDKDKEAADMKKRLDESLAATEAVKKQLAETEKRAPAPNGGPVEGAAPVKKARAASDDLGVGAAERKAARAAANKGK
jgi:hypothetical protein